MEDIEDASDLFFTDASTEKKSAEKKLFKTKYTLRQIGSIVKQISPVQGSAFLPSIASIFSTDKKLNALPVEENGVIIGMIDRATVTSETEASFSKITLKNAKKYLTVQTESIMLDANDFIERDLQKITEIHETYGLADFPVFDNKTASRKFLGIVNLNDILNRMAEIRERDLKKASAIQSSLFPTKEQLQALPYKVSSWHRMANSLGGDIYQVLRINEDESFVGIFDVSGKNVAASLITILIASFFKIANNNSFFSNKPSTFVSMLDKYISSVVEEDTFATGVVCYFNLKQNVIYIYNCGHTIAYLLYGKDGEPVQLANVEPSLSPFGIGMVSEALSKKYEKTDRPFTVLKYKQKMHIGLYSDGLTDMYNKDFEIFDEDEVKRFLTSLYSAQDEKVEEQIKRVVENFTSDTLIPDDITVVDIRL